MYTIKKETCVYNSDDMMDEVENSKGFAKKKKKIPQDPSRIREFSKFAGKKVNTQQKDCVSIY